MAQKFGKGERVSWDSGQGEATGTVEEYITESQTIEEQTVRASTKAPRYLVKNDNTGKVTGHKPDSLSKVDSQASQERSNQSAKCPKSFQPGDKVEWNTAQGKTVGEVVKKLTSSIQIKGHTVRASEDNPQYLVESDKTGEEAAHKPEALTQVN